MKSRAGIDMAFVLKKIRKNFWFIAATVVAFTALGVAVVYILPKKYNVTASLRVNDAGNSAIVENLFDGVNVVEETKNTANEIALLKSFSLVRKALDLLDYRVTYFQRSGFRSTELFENRPFTVTLDTTADQVVGIPINIRFISPDKFVIEAEEENVYTYSYRKGGGLRAVLPKVTLRDTAHVGEMVDNNFLKFVLHRNTPVSTDDDYFITLQNMDAQADEYIERLVIAPVTKEASILELNVASRVPGKDIGLVNELIKLYVDQNVMRQNGQAQRTLDFINRQLGEISDSLQHAEMSLQQFRSYNKVLDLSYESKNVYDELKALEKQKSEEQSKLKYYTYLSEYVKGEEQDLNKIVAPSVIGIQDPTLNDLIASLSGFIAEKTAINYSAKAKNPKFNILQENIENTRRAIVENVNNIRMATEIKLKDMDKRMGDVQHKINRMPETERIMLDAQRKFNFNDNIYNYFLEKQGEAAILKESGAPFDVIVDPARIEGTEPVSPNTKLILGACLGVGVMFSLALVFVRELTSTKIISKEDIEAYLPQVPILEEIPRKSKKGPHHNQLGLDKRCFEAFRSLCLKLDKKEGVRRIAVTSTTAGDGKTFCATHLAEMLALAEIKVLLVDGCFNDPALTGKFASTDPKLLFRQIESGTTTFHVHRTAFSTLHVLTAGDPKQAEQNFNTRDRYQQLLKEAGTGYDYIIIDCPDVTTSASFLAINDLTDLNLLVIRRNHSPADLSKLQSIVSGQADKYSVLFNCREI